MTKIFEALEYADRQRAAEAAAESRTNEARAELTAPLEAPKKRARAIIKNKVRSPEGDVVLESTFAALYNTIETLLPGPKGRSVQFVGANPGSGASTLVREFAKVCALRLNKSVLLLDADHHAASQIRHFGLEDASGWDPMNDSGRNIETSFNRISKSNLSVSQLVTSESFTPSSVETSRFRTELNRLKSSFDIVLIDTPPIADHPEGVTLASKVDGVVLIVEAEQTRWQVLNSVSNRIKLGGGNILGAIVNRRRHHVPEAIDKRL